MYLNIKFYCVLTFVVHYSFAKVLEHSVVESKLKVNDNGDFGLMKEM